MKFLFDENISFKLCKRLEDIYPNSTHVKFVNLQTKNDMQIWSFAKEFGYTIVTQDSDFNDMSVIYGFPPYVIWLKSGNTTVKAIENTLREHSIKIRNFIESKTLGLIEIG